jgi:hypothetical protein
MPTSPIGSRPVKSCRNRASTKVWYADLSAIEKLQVLDLCDSETCCRSAERVIHNWVAALPRRKGNPRCVVLAQFEMLRGVSSSHPINELVATGAFFCYASAWRILRARMTTDSVGLPVSLMNWPEV